MADTGAAGLNLIVFFGFIGHATLALRPARMVRAEAAQGAVIFARRNY
jgi:hypothetical protein